MTEESKTLFLLDAYALIYRAHFAFSRNPRITSKGRNTGVMFGFTNTLLEVLQKQEPSHIAVVFDTPEPTFRHEVYKEYKANRQEMPEDIREGIPVVKEILKAFNIPVMELPGYEADDLIGTLAKKAQSEGFKVFMMTPDKDFGQLVDENIFLFKPSYMGNAVDVMGIEEVKEKWGIDNVDQVRDMLGLQGDSSDNIPGIPGIGPKTAQKYIKDYGSVENLISHAGDLKGKQKETVEMFGDQGLLSKELATINIETPIDFRPKDLVYTGPDEKKLRPILEELEFRTMIQRVFSDSQSKEIKPSPSESQLDLFAKPSLKRVTNGKPTIQESREDVEDEQVVQKSNFYTRSHRQRVISSKTDLQRLVPFLEVQDVIAISTETTGGSIDGTLLGLGLCYYPEESFYIPISETETFPSELEPLKPILQNSEIVKVGHDIKPIMLQFEKYGGLTVKGEFWDIMLAHYLIDPETSHSLGALSQNYLGYELLGKDDVTSNVEVYDQASKTGEKAEVTMQLYDLFKTKIVQKEVETLYEEVESPLIEVLADMEFSGVLVDKEVLSQQSKGLEKELVRIEKEIFKLAGEEFNINSPKQLGVVLFEKLHLIDKPKKTRSGQYATGEEILGRLAPDHDIIQKILDYREYQKLKSTYLDALPDLISKYDGRIHSTFSQAIAATGRLSSNNPNLQNIPIRTEKGREIRKAFIPRDKEHKLLSADYNQIELRIMASFSGDKQLMAAFKDGQDIHTTTASRIFKVPPGEINADMRRKAKSANFGIIYGISAFGLSQNLNIPRSEASEIIETYFNEFPAVKTYMDNAIAEARKKEYVTTILGRKRYLRDINSRNATMRGYSERNAINAPIQGSAADMIKVAMIQIHSWMKNEKLKSRMILQVHDELVFDAHNSELDVLKEQVVLFMKNAVPLKVPIDVSVGIGDNWLDAH